MENYQITLEREIENIRKTDKKPRLLIHACCAPCSSYVLEYLKEIFDITLFFYNPNISPESEFERRFSELKRLNEETRSGADILKGNYDYSEFLEIAKGMEEAPEGGERCFRCYRLRLRKTAEEALKGGFDYFTTTLSISPYKNAEKLNAIGKELSEEFGVKYLFSDFKKKNGYKRSIELSKMYGLYRQDYCGCAFSKQEAEKKRQDNLPQI